MIYTNKWTAGILFHHLLQYDIIRQNKKLLIYSNILKNVIKIYLLPDDLKIQSSIHEDLFSVKIKVLPDDFVLP